MKEIEDESRPIEAPDMQEVQQDCEIDPNQLDVEAARQAETFLKWSVRLTERKIELENAESELKTYSAQLEMRVRNSPEDFKLQNVTEAGIKAACQSHERMIKRQQKIQVLRKYVGLLDAAVKSMDMKKRMLSDLVTLHGQEYFAGPSVPRDLGSAWKDFSKKREESTTNKHRSSARKRVSKED